MKYFLSFLLVVYAATAHSIDVSPFKPGQKLSNKQAHELTQRFKQRKVQDWKAPPTIDSLKDHENEDLISYGITVLDKTLITIGPNVKDVSKRYSGNSLNCSSCHLKGDTALPGTKYDAIPFTNMSNDYPQFRGRDMDIVSAAMRINGCMTRSMGNGKPLPEDSREMKGILAYFDWLAEGTQKNQAMKGTNLPKVKLPDRKADVENGNKVYIQICAACHGHDAMGDEAPDYATTGKYTFPPLAGEGSFNNGAGMSRLIKATLFVHANMPLGASSTTPIVTVDQAYDAAAYMLSLPRGHHEGRDKDFPDPDFRPADYPVPEYFGSDKAALEKARLGPYTQ